MKELSLVKIFKALSDPTRLQIVLYLLKSGEKPCTHMLHEFKLSQPTMSHHFAKLIEAGLILKEKRSTCNFYKINREYINKTGLDFTHLV
jgi:DNA-binding transcriptional ArsR family regulator